MPAGLVGVTPIKGFTTQEPGRHSSPRKGRTTDTGTSVARRPSSPDGAPTKIRIYTQTGGTPTGHWKNNHTPQDATLGAKQLMTTEEREPTRLNRALSSKALDTNKVKKPQN